MKVDAINGLKRVVFKAAKDEKKPEQLNNPEEKTQHSGKKKMLYYALGAFALAGAAAILINNARKGKIKESKPPIDLPKPPVKEPESIKTAPESPVSKPVAEPEKPVASPKVETCETETKSELAKPEIIEESVKTEDINSKIEQIESNQELKPVKIIEINEKPEFSPEALEKRAINGEVKSDAWSKNDMKEYYESGCPTSEKFNGGVEYTYPKAEDGSQFIKTIYDNGNVKTVQRHSNGYIEVVKSSDGKVKSERISNFKSKSAVEKRFDENENVVEIFSYDTKGKTRTIINGDIKSSLHVGKDGREIHKVYQKDDKGGFNLISRETVIKNKDGKDYSIKTVEYIEGGKYSKTTLTEKLSSSIKQTTSTIIRDKKGNIVDKSLIVKNIDPPEDPKSSGKVLTAWYLNYLKLCKELGIYPKGPEAGSGAWMQFRELLMRKNDPEAYSRYLRLEEYRSKYDSKAAISFWSRKLNIEEFNLGNLEVLSAEEINFLMKHISLGDIDISVQQLQKMSEDDLKLLLSETMAKIKEKAKELQRLRELQREEETQSLMILA